MKVTPDGPITAPMLFIGEAPGGQETRTGIPFYGATGKSVRGVLDRAGLSCYPAGQSKDVYFDNVIPENPGTIHANQQAALVHKHWDNITDVLRCSKPRVIVACGGVALRRLTGLENISDEHGSVIPAGDLPATVNLAATQLRLGVPESCLILPCLHPAGVMQTKLRADWIKISAVLQRAAEYAKGKPYTPEIVGENLGMTSIFWKSKHFERAMEVLRNSKVITLDTEFHRETHVPFAVGFLGDVDPMNVYWFKPEKRVLEAFVQASSGDKQWVAQYHPAELKSMSMIGVDLHDRDWYDTLLAYATLYPDAKVAIQHSTQFYCDNERNWKGLETTDPKYLAKDVRNCYQVFLATRSELAQHNMLGLFYDEVMPSMQLLEGMESRGLEVDTEMQASMLKDNEEQRTEILDRLLTRVPYSNKMVKRTMEELKQAAQGKTFSFPPCIVHPEYDGMRKKRFASDEACSCLAFYEEFGKVVRRETRRVFKPSNPHDLRWLLYTHWKLPKQRPAKGSKSPGTGADAVRRLTMRIELAYQDDKKKSKYYRTDAPEIVAFILDCKKLQHLEKAASTFLQPPVDDNHVAHPPHRQWGTGTGRLAGGFDEGVAGDGAASEYSFNPLNILKETRKLFKADTVLL